MDPTAWMDTQSGSTLFILGAIAAALLGTALIVLVRALRGRGRASSRRMPSLQERRSR